MTEKLRSLPSVDSILSREEVQPFRVELPHELLTDVIRKELQLLRDQTLRGVDLPEPEAILKRIAQALEELLTPSLQPVINATGVVLHTNLGRAPLSREALGAMLQVAPQYSNLEFDLETGQRGSRHSHLKTLLCQISGAEAALVVNNNASAVLLALSALAKGREVLISRGQSVEIGGGFRIPEVMRLSGAKLMEVGTTNRTYLADYEEAITPRTAALLRVHSSNFRVVGFTHETTIEELGHLAKRTGVLLLDDLGSGCLLDTTAFGLGAEPRVQESVAAGVDVTMFSGDKLLGGPQAGILVGRSDLIAKLGRHPLARAVRVDKATIAALAATLLHYLRDEALQKVPVWQMIAAPLGEIERRAQNWVRALGPTATVLEGVSTIGGGSLPEETLPTRLLAIHSPQGLGGKRPSFAAALARALREARPPIIGRIESETVLFDPRTVLPDQEAQFLAGIQQALARVNQELR